MQNNNSTPFSVYAAVWAFTILYLIATTMIIRTEVNKAFSDNVCISSGGR